VETYRESPPSDSEEQTKQQKLINALNNITSFVRSPLISYPQAVVDSGTTSHYLLLDSACVNKRPSAQPIAVILPNGERIISTHEARLPFPQLPHGAINAHIFPALHGHALLSVSTFCNAGCTADFTANEVKICYKGKAVLVGMRTPPGLWTINLSHKHSLELQANGTYTTQIKSNAIKFLHAACFSPATATWTKAIDLGFFKSVPLLTSNNVWHNLPKSIATAMGHLDQQRKNV
jgi:hypothetical protein